MKKSFQPGRHGRGARSDGLRPDQVTGASPENVRKMPGKTRRFFCSLPGALWRYMLSLPGRCKRCFLSLAAWGLSNWQAVAVMTVSLVLLTIGIVRLFDYSLPMLKGDYTTAGTAKTEVRFDEENKAPQPPIFQEDSAFDKSVMFVLRSTWKATDTVVGDRAEARFNEGFHHYGETRYDEAIKALNRAYAVLSGSDGKVKPKHRKLASEIQLLIGNAYANSQKISEAVNAYQLSLTYDPDNLITIYNLERLLSTGGGNGGDNGDKPKPVNPSNTKL